MTNFPCSGLIGLSILMCGAATCQADSFRCGQKLIRDGDSRADVLRICGEPLSKDRGRADVRLDGVSRNVPVERWHYKHGSRSLARVVNIYRGRVVSIEVGSR